MVYIHIEAALQRMRSGEGEPGGAGVTNVGGVPNVAGVTGVTTVQGVGVATVQGVSVANVQGVGVTAAGVGGEAPRSAFPAQRFPLHYANDDVNRQLRDLLQRHPENLYHSQRKCITIIIIDMR